MDMFIDKLAQRQTAQEIIKANNEADTKELNKLKNQIAGYNECLVKLERLIDEGFVKLANTRIDREETARVVEESISRAKSLQQDTGSLVQLQKQLDAISRTLQEISQRDDSNHADHTGMDEAPQELLLRVDSVLQKLLGDMANVMQEQLGSMNQSVQEELGNMGRAMQEQLERMGDIIQLQLKGMDKSVREQIGGVGGAMQEELGSVGRVVQEQCGNIGQSMQEEFESMGGNMQEQFSVLDKSMQNQLAGINKSVQDQIAGMNKSVQDQLDNMDKSIKKSMAEQFENMTKMLDEKLSLLGGQADGGTAELLSENIHKECVKVYRNVQAVMVEESGKQSEALAETKAGIASLKGKFGIILGISVAAMVCSLAGAALQIFNSLI